MAAEFDDQDLDDAADLDRVRVTIVVGRCRLSRDHAQHLVAGQLVPLDEPTDWPVEVLADGELVARGELVAVNGCFGVRITELAGALARWKAA